MAWTMLRFTLGCAALGMAAAGALRPVTVLQFENAARAQVVRMALPAEETFSVTYHHSIYEQPITEEFVVDADRRIVLIAVSSPSAAVREYFGITSAGTRHRMRRALGEEIVFRVAAGTPQRLTLGGIERSFLEFGSHGDRLVVRAVGTPALAHWLSGILHTSS